MKSAEESLDYCGYLIGEFFPKTKRPRIIGRFFGGNNIPVGRKRYKGIIREVV